MYYVMGGAWNLLSQDDWHKATLRPKTRPAIGAATAKPWFGIPSPESALMQEKEIRVTGSSRTPRAGREYAAPSPSITDRIQPVPTWVDWIQVAP
jgi:hypothetical protein